MIIPAGALVVERLPGDAIVARAGCVGHNAMLSDVAVIKRISPMAMRKRRVGECVIGDNSPLHTNLCRKLSTANGIFDEGR